MTMIRDMEELHQRLCRPSAELVEAIQHVASPLLVLGAGGKMGPSLCVLAKRAAEEAGHSLRVVAVSRFSDEAQRQWLNAEGVETLPADLLDRASLAKLPDARDIVYLVGLKFGTQQNPAATWAVNALVPANVVERFPQSRIAALSTGNVYPLLAVAGGGATEDTPLTPLGEYANAAVARERIFEWAAQRHGARIALIRLNYALDLRYGVLRDIAQSLWTGQTIHLANGHLNCIWQGDANEIILRSLARTENPPVALNLSGPIVSVRELATRLAELLGKTPRFSGEESPTALVSNTSRCREWFGEARTSLEDVLRWTANWVRQGGASLNKPTHFEVRDGSY